MKNSTIQLKIILASIWCALTIALISWWWIWALGLTEKISPEAHRMIKYEGATLFLIISIGSTFLIRFIWKDHQKNERLHLFFSLFTHDIKTSISRLRLQSEVFAEDLKNNTHLIRFKNDITRLDLQLENSLLLTNHSHQNYLSEEIKLSDLISSVRKDFDQLHIEINQNCYLMTDKKWMSCVFRNIFQNAITHGQADQLKIETQFHNKQNKVELKFTDNGHGFNVNQKVGLQKLGQEILTSDLNQSNGIGLYLTKLLLNRLNSEIHFASSENGFSVMISSPGKLL